LSLNCAENLQMLLEGKKPEWRPFTLDVGGVPGFTEPIMRRFTEETTHHDPAEFFDYDFRTFSLSPRFGGDDPSLLHKGVEPGTTFDEWGIGHWAGGKEGTYEKMYSPLADVSSVKEVEKLPTPIIDKNADVCGVAEYKKRGYPVFGYAGSIYEWSWWLRGMQNLMMDLVAQPALAEAIIRKVCGYTKQLALASAQAGIDVLCFYDDAGMQTGMQISPDLWRKFVKPAWADVLEAIGSKFPKARFFLHSCGNIREIVGDIVELGFDILHPVQPECMDPAEVKSQFGKDIVICTTISAQKVFPFGTEECVRREVRRLKETCGKDNRCILCPSNMIQPETPWQNIIAFAKEARADR